jgi:hypothetical protein
MLQGDWLFQNSLDEEYLSITIIMVVKCTSFFLFQIFYLIESAVSRTIPIYGAGCSISKKLQVHQNGMVGGKINKNDTMTFWIINTAKYV